MHSTSSLPGELSGPVPRVETRREPRFAANQPVNVQLLSGSRCRLSARIVNLSGRGLQIRTPKPLARNELVELRWDNQMLLGEVRYCSPEADEWLAGIEIEHALYELKSIRRFCRG